MLFDYVPYPQKIHWPRHYAGLYHIRFQGIIPWFRQHSRSPSTCPSTTEHAKTTEAKLHDGDWPLVWQYFRPLAKRLQLHKNANLLSTGVRGLKRMKSTRSFSATDAITTLPQALHGSNGHHQPCRKATLERMKLWRFPGGLYFHHLLQLPCDWHFSSLKLFDRKIDDHRCQARQTLRLLFRNARNISAASITALATNWFVPVQGWSTNLVGVRTIQVE